MNTQNQETKGQQSQNIQGYVGEVRVYLNDERATLTHRLGNEVRIEMPVNLYKQILDLPFEPKAPVPANERGPFQAPYGAIARPAIFLSKDGQYLIHRVLGVRVVKHVNYYKQILGAEYNRKNRAHQTA